MCLLVIQDNQHLNLHFDPSLERLDRYVISDIEV